MVDSCYRRAMSQSGSRISSLQRKPYEKPEVILLRIRQEGDNVLGACKTGVAVPTGNGSAFCDLCPTIGS